jgi:hypothetical protein
MHAPPQFFPSPGGFYGAIKRAGLTLTKDANGVYHVA